MRRIQNANGGVLLPEKVVDAARNPKSPLHDQFTWDDTKAAEEYRLWQARQLVARVRLEIVVNKDNKVIMVPVREHHHFSSDGAGYRSIKQVIRDEDLRNELLQQFADALDRVRAQYVMMKDVLNTPAIFEAIEAFLEEVRSSRQAASKAPVQASRRG